MFKSILLLFLFSAVVSTPACAKPSGNSAKSKSAAKYSSKTVTRSAYVARTYSAPKPAPKPTKVYKPVKSKDVEIEYFAFNDCTRYISSGFNGYRCIDRD